MRSVENLGPYPAGQALLADDILEFHAARLLLLLDTCGIKGRIDGLTKLAKLDFFVRYPAFFYELHGLVDPRPDISEVESPMIRYHYGPWDQRYYHVLSFLESRNLIRIEKQGKSYVFKLTEPGQSVASGLKEKASFSKPIEHMKRVKKALGGKSGTSLKKLVYATFDDQVANRRLGEVIRHGG
ncbi:MAG TPA: hypothetical protein VJB57_00750 [Dehalococcoidia bacterium]|nr:hypothetical protein [Dehalococcoidia bacterium]